MWDAVSVVIRHSLVQTRTPSDMLGRVIAVNALFTGTTGSLGQFRAGLFAAFIGAVPSALIGGIGAIIVTVLWMWWFPELRRIASLAHEAVLKTGLSRCRNANSSRRVHAGDLTRRTSPRPLRKRLHSFHPICKELKCIPEVRESRDLLRFQLFWQLAA